MVRKSLLLILGLAASVFADTGVTGTIKIKDSSGSPSCVVGQVNVSPGTLTCAGQTATLTTGGSGGSSSLETMVNGVRVSSPTASINLIAGTNVTLSGSLVGGTTAAITINSSGGAGGSGIVSPGTFTWVNNQGMSVSTFTATQFSSAPVMYTPLMSNAPSNSLNFQLYNGITTENSITMSDNYINGAVLKFNNTSTAQTNIQSATGMSTGTGATGDTLLLGGNGGGTPYTAVNAVSRTGTDTYILAADTEPAHGTYYLSVSTLGVTNIAGGMTLAGSAGTSGQCLTSGGAGAVPTWTTITSGGGGGGNTQVASQFSVPYYNVTPSSTSLAGDLAQFAWFDSTGSLQINSTSASSTTLICLNNLAAGGTFQCTEGGTEAPGMYGLYSHVSGNGGLVAGNGQDAVAVVGRAEVVTQGNGWDYGGQFTATNSNQVNYGVYAEGAGSVGNKYGVYGRASGTGGGNGIAIYGEGVANNIDVWGGYFNAHGGGSSLNVGVYANSSGSSNENYALETDHGEVLFGYSSPTEVNSRVAVSNNGVYPYTFIAAQTPESLSPGFYVLGNGATLFTASSTFNQGMMAAGTILISSTIALGSAGATGTSGQCLQSGGTATAPSWGSCGGGSGGSPGGSAGSVQYYQNSTTFGGFSSTTSITQEAITYNLNGQGLVISSATASLLYWYAMPYAATVSSYTVFCDSNTTSISISVSSESWTTALTDTSPGASAGSICASACPSVSNAIGATGPATGWSSLNQGDILFFNLTGSVPTNATKCSTQIWVNKT